MGLFNTQAQQHEVELSHFHLTESRILFLNPQMNDVESNLCYEKNSYTDGLRKVLVHFSTNNEPGNFVEALDTKNLYNHGLWRILENEPDDYSEPLFKNDYFRIGRQIIRVAKIFNDPSQNSKSKVPQTAPSLKYLSYGEHPDAFAGGVEESQAEGVSNKDNGVLQQCKICLETETTSNKFVNDLCKCKNMPVHFGCLKSWMSTKIQTSNFKNMTYYDITMLACEVCHERIPPMFTVNGQEVFLLNIHLKETKDVVILEMFELTREKIKGVLIVDFSSSSKSEVSLGRSEDSDVMFKDISVSRNHARLVWRNRQLFVFNVDSKYGTVRRENGQVPLGKFIGNKFVIDKFVIAVHVNRNKKVCKCLQNNKVKFSDNHVDNNKALFVKDTSKTQPLEISKTENQNEPPKQDRKPMKMAKHLDQLCSSIPHISSNKLVKANVPMNGWLGHSAVQKLESLKIIDPLQNLIDQTDQEFPKTQNHSLVKEETAKNNSKSLFAKKQGTNFQETTSQRVLDTLHQNQPKPEEKIKEILEDKDEGEFESQVGKDSKPEQLKDKRSQSPERNMQKVTERSERTISEMYLRSFREYNFN